MGNVPLTLSNVSAGTRNPFKKVTLKDFLKSAKFGPTRDFNLENSHILHPGILKNILIKNCANISFFALPNSIL